MKGSGPAEKPALKRAAAVKTASPDGEHDGRIAPYGTELGPAANTAIAANVQVVARANTAIGLERMEDQGEMSKLHFK